jgi:FkbM family methyltransferase
VNAIVNRLPIGLVKEISSLQWRSPWFRKAYLLIARSYGTRDDIIRRGPAKGLKFNSALARNAGFLLGTYEPEVQTLYASLLGPGMTVYDIGANVGFLAVLAAQLVGPGGKVVCFEPLPANAAAIEYNAALNAFTNVVVIREALGREEGTSEFLVSGDVGWGRLPGTGRDPDDFKEVIPVQVSRLSRAVDEYRLPLPDLIKVDIEGGEIGMLEGSRELLARCRPFLLVELHGTNAGVDRMLCETGYQSYVLGEPRPILEAPWDAFVVAAPKEDQEKCLNARRLAMSAALGR